MTGDRPWRVPEQGDPLAQVIFRERRVDHRDSVALLNAFYEEQVGRYGFAESVDLDPAVYQAPSGVFLVAYLGADPVGCGGCRWYNRADGVAEVKKTYFRPALRGFGLGRALLAELENHATDWGARHMILETGVRNTAALELFQGVGYEPTQRYVPGRDPQINRAFMKKLVVSSSRSALLLGGPRSE